MKTKMDTVSYVSCLFPSLGIRFQRKKPKQIKTKLKINNNKLSISFLMEVTLNELKCWFHDAKAERELYIALQSVKLKFTSENSNCNECSKL